MDFEAVVVSTFVNPYLFWIIKKKHLLFRKVIDQIMKGSPRKRINTLTNQHNLKELIAVCIDDVWVRGKIERTIDEDTPQPYYVCWLVDYGVMRVTSKVFHLHELLKSVPLIATQASFHNIANLTTEMVIGSKGYEFALKKTTNSVEGVSKVVLEQMRDAQEIHFACTHSDKYNLYGDILCVNRTDQTESLTQKLINEKLVEVDEELFATLEQSRSGLKNAFYTHSQSWHRPLEAAPADDPKNNIFNSEINKNHYMEYFKEPRRRLQRSS